MTSKKKLIKKIAKLEIESSDLKEQLVLKSFSSKAMANYCHNVKTLIHCASEIQYWFYKSLIGIAFACCPESYPLPKERDYSSCLQYIACIYEVMPSDIHLILKLK